MYNELLSGADEHKSLKTTDRDVDEKIENLKRELINKDDFCRATKRKLSVFESDLALIVLDREKCPIKNKLKAKLEEYMNHSCKVESI
jgi:hypothetical protein